MAWISYADRLRAQLLQVSMAADALLAVSSIEYRGDLNRGGGVFIVAPDWVWADPTDEVRRLQIKLVPRFDAWFEQFRFLFEGAPSDLRQEIDELGGQVREWIARDGSAWSGWDVPRNLAVAREMEADRFTKLGSLLTFIAPTPDHVEVIAIPDTSALIDASDLRAYGSLFGSVRVSIVFVPGVLSELDTLKDQGRNPEVREKARTAGRRIKEVRSGGSLIDGVELSPGLVISARPVEPDFAGLPGRLDPLSPDDRILAAAFELQRERPSEPVVLITADINLQTKAEMAGLPFVDPPMSG